MERVVVNKGEKEAKDGEGERESTLVHPLLGATTSSLDTHEDRGYDGGYWERTFGTSGRGKRGSWLAVGIWPQTKSTIDAI